MSGLYVLFIAGVWVALALFTTLALTSRIKAKVLRVVAAVVLLGVLLPLPLVDEFFGKRQFEQLCRDNAAIQLNRAAMVSKTVYFDPQPDVRIEGPWIRIKIQPVKYVDSVTGEVVMSFSEVLAAGGRLVRTVGFSEGGVPLTFRGSCGPSLPFEGSHVPSHPIEVLRELGITATDRPAPDTQRK